MYYFGSGWQVFLFYFQLVIFLFFCFFVCWHVLFCFQINICFGYVFSLTYGFVLLCFQVDMFCYVFRLTCIDWGISPSKASGLSTEEIPSKREALTASTQLAQGRITSNQFLHFLLLFFSTISFCDFIDLRKPYLTNFSRSNVLRQIYDALTHLLDIILILQKINWKIFFSIHA